MGLLGRQTDSILYDTIAAAPERYSGANWAAAHVWTGGWDLEGGPTRCDALEVDSDSEESGTGDLSL
jgi:hypothetical protein